MSGRVKLYMQGHPQTMSSEDARLEQIVEMLSPLGEITWKMMMGEYLLYLDGFGFGGIYDDRLMLKPTPSVDRMIPDAPREAPYPGAGEMVVADDVPLDTLMELLPQMCFELPKKKACRPF